MTKIGFSVKHLSDADLLMEVGRLAGQERQATAQLIAALAELDVRRLYLGEGCSSLFSYCTQVLHLSEHAAYGRIEAARVARRLPVVLDLLADGSITLTTVTLLGPHLTDANHRALLEEARHRSRRDVERIIARLRPQADVPSSTRKLPVRQPPAVPLQTADPPRAPGVAELLPAPAPSSNRPPVVAPLAPARYKVQFTVAEETYEKLRRAQDLLRHTIPNGDPAAIFDRALTLLVADLERRRLARGKREKKRGDSAPERTDAGRAQQKKTTPVAARPRENSAGMACSRHIPAAVKRAVWSRDGGQCTFVGSIGRCTERGFLEFHHVVPFARGGEATVDNICLRCRNHNQHEGEQEFGRCRRSRVRKGDRRGDSDQPLLVRERCAEYVIKCSGLSTRRKAGNPVRTELGGSASRRSIRLETNQLRAYSEAASAGSNRVRAGQQLLHHAPVEGTRLCEFLLERRNLSVHVGEDGGDGLLLLG